MRAGTAVRIEQRLAIEAAFPEAAGAVFLAVRRPGNRLIETAHGPLQAADSLAAAHHAVGIVGDDRGAQTAAFRVDPPLSRTGKTTAHSAAQPRSRSRLALPAGRACGCSLPHTCTDRLQHQQSLCYPLPTVLERLAGDAILAAKKVARRTQRDTQ